MNNNNNKKDIPTSPLVIPLPSKTMPFEAAQKLSSHHLIPQSTDVSLNPPESYFFITDFLIISCGILYTLCYIFYTIRTYSDGFLAGTVQFLSATMAYEIYYAVTRYLGCITAFLVFIWRYVNVPENWAYVGNWWSIGGMIVTLLPETVYPFFYVWAHHKEREKKEKTA